MFAVLKAARELKQRERAEFMKDLINVAFVPAGKKEFIDSLRKFWSGVQESAVPEFSPKRPVIKEDGTPVVPWELATKIMVGQMRAMKRINGGG